MDFHSLTRRELQSLCKLNKIPANITNVAMADALKSLEIVQGIEEFLNVSKSETADLVESMELLEVSSPKAPNTKCRTSTRQKVKNTEAENLPPTATRTTRRGTKQPAKGIEETKNGTLKTPAVSSSRRKALATSSCRKLNTQLNESEEEEGFVDQKADCIPNTPASVVMNSRRKATTVKEGPVQKTYSTRRSTRLTAKKSSEPRVEKESENVVQIDSFLDEVSETSKDFQDEVNATSEDVSSKLVEAQENTNGSDSPKPEVEDICVAFEKIAVLIEEDLNVEATQKSGEGKEVSGGLDNLKVELDETSNPCVDGNLEVKEEVEARLDLVEVKTDDVSDQKHKSDSISTPSEDEAIEEKLDLGEEKFVASGVDDQNPCDNENLEEKAKIELDVVKKVSSEVETDEVFDQKVKSDSITSPSEFEDLEEIIDLGEEKLDMVEMVSAESKIDEVFDHGISSPCEDEDLDEPDFEKFDVSEVNDQNPCDEDLEEKLDVAEKVGSEMKTAEVMDILSPCEDVDFGEEKFDPSEVHDQNLDMVSGEQSDYVVDSNPEVFKSEETFDQKAESEGELNPSEVVDQNLSDNMVDDDDTSELTDEAFNQKPISDIISNSSEDDELIKDKLDASEDIDQNLESVDETFVVKIPTADSLSSITEEIQDANPEIITDKVDAVPAQNPSMVFSDVIGHNTRVTPMKKSVSKTQTPFKNMTVVSDDKENIDKIVFVDEGKKIKKENNANDNQKNPIDVSLRQLRKQLKALTLKNINAKEDAAATKEVTTRHALQVLPENQLVGDETKN